LDSTQAFLDAWTAACGSTNSNNDLHIYLKEGINLLGSVSFEGHNYTSPDITLRIDGTRLIMRIIAYLIPKRCSVMVKDSRSAQQV
jgi:polygalacturonase